MSDNDVDEGSVDPLDLLADHGFVGGEAVDALMQAGGNVEKALDILRSFNETASGKTKPTTKAKTKKKRDGKNKSKGSPTNKTGDDRLNLSFKDQRKEELKAKKAVRDSKRICRVCGGPHLRKECPGIADDGRGHSRYHANKGSRREDTKQRKEFHQQQEVNKTFLDLGHWTQDIEYIDGFADLGAALQHNHQSRLSGADEVTWFREWGLLEVSLGPKLPEQTPEQRKKELKMWSGTKLRQKAAQIVEDEQRVTASLEKPNPRSELINIILEAEEATNETEFKDYTRKVQNEWPGYAGCLAPLSMLMERSEHILSSLEGTSGIKILLSLSPSEIAEWMVVKMEDQIPCEIDVSFLAKTLGQENTNTSSDSVHAKLGRTTPEEEIARFRKVLKLQHSRLFDTKELSDVVAGSARWDRERVEKILQIDGAKKDTRTIVGVSCGLNYQTPEARHSLFGPTIRQAQRDACTIAVQLAVKANVPIVLECQQSKDQEEESVTKDLVLILANHAPPETRMLLRNGALTTASKPGLDVLMQTWENLYVGLDAKVAYSKCSKELLDIAFDLPLERLVLTSESPTSLPPVLKDCSHLIPLCLPPHVACCAQAIAKIKNGGVSDGEVLTQSTSNIRKLFSI